MGLISVFVLVIFVYFASQHQYKRATFLSNSIFPNYFALNIINVSTFYCIFAEDRLHSAIRKQAFISFALQCPFTLYQRYYY